MNCKRWCRNHHPRQRRLLFLDDILDGVYRDFKALIPYDRIGFSLIEEKGTLVRARWAQADYAPLQLTRGYAAKLAGSTLEIILKTGQPHHQRSGAVLRQQAHVRCDPPHP